MQTFQTNFFNYLSIFNHFVASLSEGNREGRECTAEWRRLLRIEYDGLRRRNGSAKTECFDLMKGGRKNHLLPYFQHLQNLLDLLAAERDYWSLSIGRQRNTSPTGPDTLFQVEKYLKMIRAQLSPDESELLRYYCFSSGGQPMEQLVLQLNLLDELGKDTFADCAE
jgi:hypothetical protein